MEMAVMDHIRTAYSCDCGGSMQFRRGTITGIVRGRQIQVRNAPHYVCKECGEIVYDLSANISTVLAAAYKAGEKEIDYELYHG